VQIESYRLFVSTTKNKCYLHLNRAETVFKKDDQDAIEKLVAGNSSKSTVVARGFEWDKM
jgi:hypothetical protein